MELGTNVLMLVMPTDDLPSMTRLCRCVCIHPYLGSFFTSISSNDE